MASICKAWDIPYLNLSDIHNPSEIQTKMMELDPKILLTSIEDISNPAIQSELQALDIHYIAIDEAQVLDTCHTFLPSSLKKHDFRYKATLIVL